jgi:hypothetical protein
MDKLILWLFRIIGAYAIPVLALNAYADYKIFILFGENLHAFTTYTIQDIPFYLFCLGIIISSAKKFYPLLWLSPIATLIILKNEGSYFYQIIQQPDTITIPFMTFLAAITCIFVLLTLFTWILWVSKKYITHQKG